MNCLNFSMKLIVFFSITLLGSAAWASCATNTIGIYTYSLPAQSLSVPRDKPSESTLGGVKQIPDPVAASKQGNFTCGPGWSYVLIKYATPLEPSGYEGIYKTNIDGIGIKVWVERSGVKTIVDNDIKLWYPYTNMPTTRTDGGWIFGVRVQLYVIGPVSTGNTHITIPVDLYASSNANVGEALYHHFYLNVDAVTVTAASCVTPDITVDFQKHSASDFHSVGATSAPVPFNFQINSCNPNLNAVKFRFEPAADVQLIGTGNDQYITLKGGATASGVGIQILDNNDAVIPFKINHSFLGYNAVGGSYHIPMKARYIRTGQVSAGSANSAAEFFMSYE